MRKIRVKYHENLKKRTQHFEVVDLENVASYYVGQVLSKQEMLNLLDDPNFKVTVTYKNIEDQLV